MNYYSSPNVFLSFLSRPPHTESEPFHVLLSSLCTPIFFHLVNYDLVLLVLAHPFCSESSLNSLMSNHSALCFLDSSWSSPLPERKLTEGRKSISVLSLSTVLSFVTGTWYKHSVNDFEIVNFTEWLNVRRCLQFPWSRRVRLKCMKQLENKAKQYKTKYQMGTKYSQHQKYSYLDNWSNAILGSSY